jgi:crotonobetainyl-CoA:carnitine CoA-transferase CaiB-like acyl-CoA transferase
MTSLDLTAAIATYRPLDGVRVLDLSRLIPGALATRKLADLGADVVKIEEPGRGDYLRTIAPLVDGQSVMHHLLNRGKKSVAADYRTAEGRGLVERLAAVAEVVVEVSRPGRLAGAGLDLHQLRARRPEVVVCSITGFGQTGPLADLPSHGMNIDALAGCLTPEHDGRPRLAAGIYNSIGAELGGLNAAVAVLAALVRARASGEGAWIDISCWDAAVEFSRYRLAYLEATGEDMEDVRELGPLYDVYEAAGGGLVFLGAIEQKFWENFCRGLGRDDLRGRWSSDGDVHFAGDDDLRRELEAVFLTATAEVWSERFLEWEVPGSRVQSAADVLASPHLAARRLVRRDGSAVPQIAEPVRWIEPGGRPGDDAAPSPELGADTDDVVRRWLG